ncbi:MAG: hypothetical protein QOJ02_1412 [Acidobacteriota bacterium]|jgi:hypothetical protein|nr:hypothetical protein [Acidobacteriota bacterium]
MAHLRLYVSALFVLTLVSLVNAQTPPAPASTPKSTGASGKNRPSARKEADLVLAARRSVAISLLTSLADEARGYRDETLRARIQAQIADVIWEQEPERGRDLFRRAWEAAESVEGSSVANEEPARPGRFSKRPAVRPRTNLRLEILRLVARRDRALSEEFLDRLTVAKSEEADRVSDGLNDKPAPELSQAAINARIRIANQFLESDDIEHAIQFADPALVQVNMSAVRFLVDLREKNAAAADLRFASLLSRIAADPSSDANTVSLLTSYVFTPSNYLTVSETGIPSSVNMAPRPAPELAPSLRAAFLRIAADILLRPSVQLDHTSARRAGTYYIIARLLPVFEQHAPVLAPALSAQLAALRPDAPQQLLSGNDFSLGRGIVPESATGDRIQDELENSLSRARSADERDVAFAFAAVKAANGGEHRAYEFLNKIGDLETRNGVRRFLDYSFIGALLNKKNAEGALRLARKSELTHAQRTHVLTQIVELLAKTDRVRAIELLDETVAESNRIDVASDRAYALLALAAQASNIDLTRTWELVDETVKAANGVDDFTGEGGRSVMRLEGKFKAEIDTMMASPDDLRNLFAALADDDLNRASDVAKNFDRESPRSLAIIAIARSILDKKQGK